MTDTATPDRRNAIEVCQKILRFSTGVILTAFLLIIIITTISTDQWVQTAGKGLYYIIMADAFVSLGVWYYRTRLEKAAEGLAQ